MCWPRIVDTKPLKFNNCMQLFVERNKSFGKDAIQEFICSCNQEEIILGTCPLWQAHHFSLLYVNMSAQILDFISGFLGRAPNVQSTMDVWTYPRGELYCFGSSILQSICKRALNKGCRYQRKTGTSKRGKGKELDLLKLWCSSSVSY